MQSSFNLVHMLPEVLVSILECVMVCPTRECIPQMLKDIAHFEQVSTQCRDFVSENKLWEMMEKTVELCLTDVRLQINKNTAKAKFCLTDKDMSQLSYENSKYNQAYSAKEVFLLARHKHGSYIGIRRALSDRRYKCVVHKERRAVQQKERYIQVEAAVSVKQIPLNFARDQRSCKTYINSGRGTLQDAVNTAHEGWFYDHHTTYCRQFDAEVRRCSELGLKYDVHEISSRYKKACIVEWTSQFQHVTEALERIELPDTLVDTVAEALS